LSSNYNKKITQILKHHAIKIIEGQREEENEFSIFPSYRMKEIQRGKHSNQNK